MKINRELMSKRREFRALWENHKNDWGMRTPSLATRIVSREYKIFRNLWSWYQDYHRVIESRQSERFYSRPHRMIRFNRGYRFPLSTHCNGIWHMTNRKGRHSFYLCECTPGDHLIREMKDSVLVALPTACVVRPEITLDKFSAPRVR